MERKHLLELHPVQQDFLGEQYDLQNQTVACTSPSRLFIRNGSAKEGPIIGEKLVRCRKCDPCGRFRQRLWSARAKVEQQSSVATWWVTLTYRGTTPHLYRDIQKMFRKMRKDGFTVRYMISEEISPNGRLHHHLLLHTSPHMVQDKLDSYWSQGFTHRRLAKTSGLAVYMAKYAAKQSHIRASKGYGDLGTALCAHKPDLGLLVCNYWKDGSPLPCGIIHVGRYLRYDDTPILPI